MLSKSEIYTAEYDTEYSAILAKLERDPKAFFEVLVAEFLAGANKDRKEAEISLRAIWLLFRRNDAALDGHSRAVGRYINSLMEQHANWRAADSAEVGLEDILRHHGAI